MYYWYKFITFFFYPFAPIYLYFRKIRKKEDSNRYKEKLAKINIERGEGFLIWFHVASVGEAMSILPLIDGCIKEKKINRILITSITLSSGKILEKRFNNNPKINHQFLPLDIISLINKFLDHWKPNLSIFIDSEIWPNLILKINEKKIPLLLVNARITKKSFDRWKLVMGFAKKIFGKFDLCIASNNESENFLKILGSKNIKNYGNLKFSNIKNDIKKLDLNGRNPRNRRGTYFQRLIDFPGTNGGINQLENIIESIQDNKNNRRSRYQASTFDPNSDKLDGPYLGFPCLQHITFYVTEENGLVLNSFYAVQHLYEKAYGNWLGLVNLGKFVAEELGISFERFNCFISIEKLDSLSKTEAQKLYNQAIKITKP